MISATLPAQEPDLWLGDLVLEVQLASDRATARARQHAESVVAAARVEAEQIRERGSRRAQLLMRIRDLGRAVGPPRGDSGLGQPVMPVPPRPRISQQRSPLPVPPLPDAAPQEDPQAPPAGPKPVVHTVPFLPPGVALLPPPAPLSPAGASDGSRAKGDATPAPAATRPSILSIGDEAVGAASPATVASRPGARDHRPLVSVLMVMLVLVGYWTFEQVVTAAREHRGQQTLLRALADLEARPPSSANPASGQPLGALTIPRIGINGLAVAEGATINHLHDGPAHDSSSQMPRQRGAVVILGHRRAYGGVFARLGDLRVGDVVVLRTPAGEYGYRVARGPQILRSTLTLPSAAEVQASGGASTHADQVLVLATGVSGGDTPLRVVAATLDQSTTITAGGPPASAPTSTVLHSVPGQRIGLFWAGMWIVTLILLAICARRLGRSLAQAVVYPAAAVMALIVLYQIYSALDRLIPGTS